jgi:hypothetical protein
MRSDGFGNDGYTPRMRELLELKPYQPTEPLQPITPVGDNSVIEALEKSIPYQAGEARYLEEAQLEAYKNRK